MINALDAAEKQLGYAQALTDRDFTTSSLINERLRDIQSMQAEMDRS